MQWASFFEFLQIEKSCKNMKMLKHFTCTGGISMKYFDFFLWFLFLEEERSAGFTE